MKKTFWEKLLFNVSRFLSFFLLLCAITTIVILLFMRGMPIDEAVLRRNAPLTFLAIFVMTIVGCVVDSIRRYGSVDRPLKRILETLDRLGRGDFSLRLDTSHRDINHTGFRTIAREINTLADELSGLETLRTDFIANVSHELKTPLAVLQGYAAILRDPSLPEDQRQQYVEKIVATTRRLAELVSNILKLNKLENQQIYPQTRVFDLGEQLAQSILHFEEAWDAKNLIVDCDLTEDVRVAADPELLEIVWHNLVSNAVKFTPEGGRITVTLTVQGKTACVSVSDTGCGMTRETGAHIFEKFYQGDTAHSSQGNGLGLALVKRVVDITGGSITVASAPGRGATFTVRLERV